MHHRARTRELRDRDQKRDRANCVQVLNPATGRYVLVDKNTGRVVGQSRIYAPYIDVPIITLKEKKV